jgi:hypothetical protein
MRKTANNLITTDIIGAVPQPVETFPYSEFRGFSRVPRRVTNPKVIFTRFSFTGLLEVTIKINKKEY